MDTPILLTSLQMVDILFRFATAGTLSLLFLFLFRHGEPGNKTAVLCFIACLIGYVLLTAPIEDEHYGWLRPPLLLLTNCTPYALLAVYWFKVHGNPLLSVMPVWSRFVVLAWFLWLGYFYLIQAGVGGFGRWHHGIDLVLLGFIVVDAIRDLDDDLVESRRDIRKLTITFVSLYVTFLTVIEVFFKPLKDDGTFSVVNALFILLFTLFVAYRTLAQGIKDVKVLESVADSTESTSEVSSDPAVQRLQGLMEQGMYSQNGLTIAKLADAMEMPQHQLRVLINQQLGFDNFSQFLNSHRIPAVCQKLQLAEHQDTPILTLALESGYNSIAPFNRAFKDLKGMTPTQYRQGFAAHFQK